MSENQIKVTATTNKPLRVNVTAPDTQGNVTLSPDTSAYNAGLAEQWAISDKLVMGKDYSSKYYANQAKENALSVESYAEDVNTIYNSFTEISNQAMNELVATRDEALTAINDRFEEGVGDGVNQITVLVDNSIAEYTEISNQIKQDNSEASKLAQDWATSEVLVDNLDYSAKYYAEKAKDNSGIFYDELTDEDIDVEILDVSYATKSELELGLDTKQDKGNYALKSEIPNISNLATKDELPTQVSELENDSNYATQTQVLQAIASIPQFKLSIVEALPTTGEKMTLYLVPKEGTNNDVYDEYIWIEQTSSFEHLGTTAVDLTDYVKNTDYATTTTAGVVKLGSTTFGVTQYNGYLQGYIATLENYNNAGRPFIPCKGTLENIKNDLVKRAVTENDIELTDDEKTSARTWIGAIGNTDYAQGGAAGIVKASGTFACGCVNGYLQTTNLTTIERYNNLSQYGFIGKGTLETVLTQYSKTVLTTEDDYNALATKDANTLYLIEE
jgi:hypothetical protein